MASLIITHPNPELSSWVLGREGECYQAGQTVDSQRTASPLQDKTDSPQPWFQSLFNRSPGLSQLSVLDEVSGEVCAQL